MQLRSYSFTEGTWNAEPDGSLDSERTLVLCFGASNLLDCPDPVRRLVKAFPRAVIMGCSTSGEIHGTRIHDDSVVAAVTKFDNVELRLAHARIRDTQHSFVAGERIASQLKAADLRAVLVLSDGLKVNGSELVRGVNSVLPPEVTVTGGLAGDGDRFSRTWVIARRHMTSGFAVAVGFYGDSVRVGHGSKGGWDSFGVERLVTRASGSVLYELDGRPALQLYKQYLGERAEGLPATGLLFPLTLRADGDKRLVRTILAVDESAQSMTFAGDIPEGSYAQLMCANFDRLVQGAGEAALSTHGATPPGSESLAIAISCVGRRLVLGERAEEETEATLDVLPERTQQIGFYSYGEISPYARGHCDLHNQTMTLTTLAEARAAAPLTNR